MSNEIPAELVKCTNCGWVYYPVSRAHAEEEVTRFNIYYDRLPPEKQANYSGRSQIAAYLACRWCKCEKFEPCSEDACPVGATLQPVVFEFDGED